MSTTLKETSYVEEVIAPFLKEFGDKKIPQDILDFYRAYAITNNSQDQIIVEELRTDEGELIALSCCVVRDGKEVMHSVTVTHKDHRKQGHGKMVFDAKVQSLKQRDLTIKSEVNLKNTGGLALCKTANMVEIDKTYKHRVSDNKTYLVSVLSIVPEVKETA